jgi:RNA polymerase sigma factor (sigma-70 family)
VNNLAIEVRFSVEALLAAVNAAAIHAVLALDEAHGHLVNARAVAAAPPSDRWYRLLDQFASKAAAHESAPAVPFGQVGERTDRFTRSLLVAAAAFLAAEANDLEDRIELLPPDERQQEGTRALLSDTVDKVCDDADVLIGRVEDGTWQEFLDADRVAFARRWADVITCTNSLSIGRDGLVRHLLGLTHQLVEATLAAEFDPSAGPRIGVDMVAAHFTGTETLSETLALIAEGLPDLLDQARPGVDVASRVARLTGHLAAGYTGALRELRVREAAIPRTTPAIRNAPAIQGTTATISSYAAANASDNRADLLLRIRDGDPAAWNEILRRYGKLVSTTVRSFGLKEADARDAVEMTWLRLGENAHRVQSPERLGGWLATTARRECLRILRQATVADPSVGPEQRVIDADTARKMWELVAELSPRRQSLLRTLFTDNPASYAEIAHVAGIPPGEIGPTRIRALQQLRRKLSEYELGLDGV